MSLKINLYVKPNSSTNKILGWKEIDNKKYLVVHIKDIAEDGKANKAVISLLAKKFKVNKSQISLVFGVKNRYKIVKIEDMTIKDLDTQIS